ncbi:MAG: DNA repair exonuclease, partial [Thermoleophilia bacterium]
MPACLLHISDLHVGTFEEPGVEASLQALVGQLQPELVIATGDLTHRGRPWEHERAARFLRSLGPPVLAVPGNHDIPTFPPGRFTKPWRAFEHQWQTTEPVYRSQSLVVVGLNSVRPWRHQSGGLSTAALRRAAERLADTPE